MISQAIFSIFAFLSASTGTFVSSRSPASAQQWLPTCSEPSLLRLHPQEEAQQLWVCMGVWWGWEGSFFPFPSTHSFLSPLKRRANIGTVGNHARRSDGAYLVLMNRLPAPQSRLFARIAPHCCWPVSEAELSCCDYLTRRAKTTSYWVLPRKHM